MNGDGTYKVLSLKGKPGSLVGGMKTPKMSLKQEGIPWVWLKNVKKGKIELKACPK